MTSVPESEVLKSSVAGLALGQAGVGVFHYSPRDGLRLGDSFLAVLGYRRTDVPDDATGWLASLVHPEDSEGLAADRKAMLDKGAQQTIREFRLQHERGDYTPVRGVATRNAGKIVGTIQDISEICCARQQTETLQRQAEHNEQKLRQANEFLDSIVENLPLMIFVKDAALRFVRFNRAGEELLGHRREDLIGKNDYDFFPKDQADFFTDRDRAVLAGGTLVNIPEEPIETAHGRRFLHTLKVPIVDSHSGQPAYLLGISEDITERKQAEEALQNYQIRLRSAAAALATAEEKERQRIAEGLHDVTLQSLAALQLTLSSLRDDRSEPAAMDKLSRAMQLTESVICETRTLVFELSPPILGDFGLGAALQWLSRRLAEQHQVAYEVNVHMSDVPLNPDVAAYLYRAVRELWQNALKHGQANRIRTTLAVHDDRLQIVVKDDGTGLDANIDRSLPEVGYGLFNIRERIQRFGGHVDIDSADGEGATITLTLPLASVGV